MRLSLPTPAVLQSRYAFGGHVRQKLLFNLVVKLVALLRRHIGIVVTSLLEIVHDCSVRNKCNGAGNVVELVFFRFVAEKQFQPRISQKFHRHGMDFRRFHGNRTQKLTFDKERLVKFQGMTELVCKHVNIAGRPVPVGKDERQLVLGQSFAIATAPLAFT